MADDANRPQSEQGVTGAMVMAAGLGKRMRPLTATTPKPLVRVAGQALIDHTLEHLAAAGVRDVVVNVHYLADALEAHVAKAPFGMTYTISDEREKLLETGGGLVKALPLIDADPFFCVNSDNIWVDGPRAALTQLADEWRPDRMDALLLVVPHARAHHHGSSGDFHLDGSGRVSRKKERKVAPFIFTGIQLMAKKLVSGEPGEAFSTNRFWDQAIEDGRLYGSIFDGEWFDIGTPAAIKPTEAWFANG